MTKAGEDIDKLRPRRSTISDNICMYDPHIWLIHQDNKAQVVPLKTRTAFGAK